jgi:C4-type Zn-finger protein
MSIQAEDIEGLLERVMEVERRFANERKNQQSERRSRVRQVIEEFATKFDDDGEVK